MVMDEVGTINLEGSHSYFFKKKQMVWILLIWMFLNSLRMLGSQDNLRNLWDYDEYNPLYIDCSYHVHDHYFLHIYLLRFHLFQGMVRTQLGMIDGFLSKNSLFCSATKGQDIS